jgi:hypothetical protein
MHYSCDRTSRRLGRLIVLPQLGGNSNASLQKLLIGLSFDQNRPTIEQHIHISDNLINQCMYEISLKQLQ